MRRALLILLPLLALAAALLYTFLAPATATFFLIAGVLASSCAAGTILLGAYSRNKAIARQNELDSAQSIQAPTRDEPPQ